MTRKATLPKLTRRERTAAAACIQFEDASIPAPARKALAKLGVKGDDALARVGAALASHRAEQAYTAARLAVSERRDQARDTAAVVLDLIERVPCLDPEIVARMNARRFATRRAGFAPLWDATLPALGELHALLTAAAGEIDREPPRRGRKPGREPVYRAVLAEIAARGALGTDAAREQAASIAALCGAPLPGGERTRRRRSTGQK